MHEMRSKVFTTDQATNHSASSFCFNPDLAKVMMFLVRSSHHLYTSLESTEHSSAYHEIYININKLNHSIIFRVLQVKFANSSDYIISALLKCSERCAHPASSGHPAASVGNWE